MPSVKKLKSNMSFTDNGKDLRRFHTKQRVMNLSDKEVEQLRQDAGQGDPLAQYGYGRWLSFAVPHDGALQEAEQLLFAAKDTVPDSMAAYSQMLHYGETSITHPAAMDIEESHALIEQAIAMGSELAENFQSRHRIYGHFCKAEPGNVAAEIRSRLSSNPDCDPFWHCTLAFALEELGRNDEARTLYEQALQLGETDAYGYLAILHQQRGNTALYEEYMEEGLAKGDAFCCLYQADTDDDLYLSLPPDEQQRLHLDVSTRLHRGLQQAEGACAYYLWLHHHCGGLGFDKDDAKAFAYLRRGVQLGSSFCISPMIDSATNGELPPSMALSSLEIDELRLQAARYNPGDTDTLTCLADAGDPAFLLKHKEELEKYWYPLIEETLDDMDDVEDDDGRYDAYI